MNWPLSQDYNEAVQSAKSSFADPDLKSGEVVPGPMGLPLPRSGNFADVYQFRGADGRMWAVKCFTRHVEGLGERYAKIDQHLRKARLPFAVGFRFLPEGIRVRGQWYPILKMEWVEGFTLNEFVRQQAGKADQLRALLGMWIRLGKRLREVKIAHADLQHGNVLLVPGETANKLKLRLIDYDGMWVPALAGKPSGEAGHPAYQHPSRMKERVYSAEVDRFPHLVMGCALRAIAIAGKPLWDKFDNGDNLLFREADFADPSKSKLFKTLWEMDDPTVTNLLALLAVCGRRPLKDTPWLDELLSGEKSEPVSDAVLARAADMIGVTHRSARKAAPVAQIYVVPEEANAFADLGADWNDPARPLRRHKAKASPVAMIAAGSVALVAVAVVVAILLSRRGKDTPPDPGNTQTTGSVKGGPSGTSKPGQLKTEWVALSNGLPIGGAKTLAEGIDKGTPGKFVRPYLPSTKSPLGVWLMADGARAIVARPNAIGVLDLASGKVETAVHDISAVRAAVTPDAKYAVIADRDQIVRVFEMQTGLEVYAHKFLADAPALRITPDGKRVAISADGVGYSEWALPDGKELRRHEALQASLFAFSLDGTRAIAADKDGGVELWDMDDGKATVLSPSMVAAAVCVTADGKRGLAASADSKEIRVWDMRDGKALPGLPTPIKHHVTAIASAADGTILVGGDDGEVAFIPESAPGEVVFQSPAKDAITGFAITGDSRHMLVATEKSALHLSRVRPKVAGKGDLPASAGFLDLAQSMPIAADANIFAADTTGERFLVASKDRLTVYDAATFRAGETFRVVGTTLAAAGFGPDNLVVICEREAGEEYRTRTYDLKRGEPGTNFAPPVNAAGPEGGRVSRVVPVPDRKFVIATTAVVGDVLYDTRTGRPATGWPAAKRDDQVVATSRPDGNVIAFGSNTRPVQLWDCDTTTFRRPFEASLGFRRLMFTPDGNKLIGLGAHSRIRVWDAETGKVIKDVDHSDPGPLDDLATIGNDLVALSTGTAWMLLNSESGKVLDVAPDVLAARGFAIPKRGWVLTANADNRLAAWNVDTKRARAAPARPPRKGNWPDVALVRDSLQSPPVGIAFVDSGKKVLVASQSGLLTRYTADRLLFDRETDAADLPLREMVVANNQLFTLGRRSVVIRNAETLEKVADFPVTIPTGPPPMFAVHPDGSYFLSGTDKVRLIEVKTKKETILATPKAAGVKPLTQFAFSADGKSGVARWGNSITTVWLPKQTGEGKVLEDAKTTILAAPDALALSPDGKTAVLGSRTGEIKAWDMTNGKQLFSEKPYEIGGEPTGVESVRFLPDGTRFATVAVDGRIVLYSGDGFAKKKFHRAPPGNWQIAESPDGRSLVLVQGGMMAIVGLEN